MYIHREIEELLSKALNQFPVCLITGPRQAGKSTLLQHLLRKFNYITLDDPFMRELANRDPELFLSRNTAPLIIDEIQYAPSLLSFIKIRVDKKRREYGQYVLTGSQIFQLMKGVSETLAGRIAIFNLYPLCWEEIKTVPHHNKSMFNDIESAKQTVTGFYPEFFVNKHLDKNLWFGSYLSTYIERDVRNIQNIPDLNRFQTFIGLLATRAGQLINFSEISREVGVSQPTIKNWISILESTYIIYLLKPYHNNRTKRLVKSPKLYFVDTGLLCYLLGIDSEERFFKASERGHIFENMVVMECIKRLATISKRSECYFYRTMSGLEVDLIVEQNGKLAAYEIKFSKTPALDSAKSLKKFKEDHKVKISQVLSLQEKSVPLSDEIEEVHWSQLQFPD